MSLFPRTSFAPALLLSLTAAGAFVFFILGVNRTLEFDEAFYADYLVRMDFTERISALIRDNHAILYPTILDAWSVCFGHSEAVLRSVSGLCYAGSAVVLYFVARDLFDRKAGCIAFFLSLTGTLAIFHGREARPYALLAFLSALTAFFYFRLFFGERRKGLDFVGFTLVALLGLLTHYWFMFVLFGFGVAGLFFARRERRRDLFISAGLILLGFGILWGPVFYLQLTRGSGADTFAWKSRPDIFDLARTFLFYFGNGEWPAVFVYLFALGAGLVGFKGWRPAVVPFEKLRSAFADRKALALLVVLFATLLLPFLLSYKKPLYLPYRYPIAAFFALVLFLAGYLSRLADARVLLFSGFLFLFGVAGAVFVSWGRAEQLPLRVLISEKLSASSRVPEIAIFTSLSRLPVEYALYREGMESRFENRTFPDELMRFPGARDAALWRQKRAELENEAERLVLDLKARAALRGERIFLFYGCDTETGDILKERLDENFELVQAVHLPDEPGRDVFFNAVLIYEWVKRPAPK